MKERVFITWISAEGFWLLKLSEKEAIAQMNARAVRENVSRAFALYPKECIFYDLLLFESFDHRILVGIPVFEVIEEEDERFFFCNKRSDRCCNVIGGDTYDTRMGYFVNRNAANICRITMLPGGLGIYYFVPV